MDLTVVEHGYNYVKVKIEFDSNVINKVVINKFLKDKHEYKVEKIISSSGEIITLNGLIDNNIFQFKGIGIVMTNIGPRERVIKEFTRVFKPFPVYIEKELPYEITINEEKCDFEIPIPNDRTKLVILEANCFSNDGSVFSLSLYEKSDRQNDSIKFKWTSDANGRILDIGLNRSYVNQDNKKVIYARIEGNIGTTYNLNFYIKIEG